MLVVLKDEIVLKIRAGAAILAIAALAFAFPVVAQEAGSWEKDRQVYNALSDKACVGDGDALRELMQGAYERQSPPAQNALRWVYMTKRCTFAKDDQSVANALLKSASDVGYPIAQSNLGLAYIHGMHGLEKNVEEGWELLELAIDNGYPRAAVHLANELISGKNLRRDLEYSSTLLKIAEDSGVDGEIVAMARGRLYEATPNATRADLEKAAAAYARAGSGDAAKAALAAVNSRLADLGNAATAEKAAPTPPPTSTQTASGEPLPFAALSISTGDAAFGWSYDQPDQAAAEARAQEECRARNGADCGIKLVFEGRGCGAYDYGEGGSPHGWGTSRDKAEATQRAARECSSRNGDAACTGGKVWVCNTRSESEYKVVYEAENDSRARKPAVATAVPPLFNTNVGDTCPVVFVHYCENFTGETFHLPGYESHGRILSALRMYGTTDVTISFRGCGSERASQISWLLKRGDWSRGYERNGIPKELLPEIKQELDKYRAHVQARYPECHGDETRMSIGQKAIDYLTEACAPDDSWRGRCEPYTP